MFLSRTSPDQVTEDDLREAQVCFLDHDMCQQTPEGCMHPLADDQVGLNFLDPSCGCPTGTDLVHRMAGQPARPVCCVHTANPEGGNRMTKILRDAGFCVTLVPIHHWTDRLARQTLQQCRVIP